jgi:hypothetical protein
MASINYKSNEKKAGIGIAGGPARRYGKKRLDWSLLPKLMVGVFNAVLGLTVAVIFFSYGDEKIVPIAGLQSKCQGFSDSHSVAKERSSVYAFCIGHGIHFSPSPALAQLR